MKRFRVILSCKLTKWLFGVLIIVTAQQTLSAQGIIILEQPTPSTSVIVTATQQVILKTGFHAVGSSGNFDAKIGAYNSISPLIPVAVGSINIPAAPTSGQNYISTSIYLLPQDNSPVINTIQYLDGLDRPTQTVQKGVTPTGSDLISWKEYDGFGREWMNHLPTNVGGNFGQYVDASILNGTANSLYNSDSRPFVETLLETSPLNRELGQKGAGADWDLHPTTVDYQNNDGSIANFFASNGYQLVKGVNYATNTLYKTITTDEDVKTATVYKDKQGRIIMKQSSTDVQTYYVYNDLDQLCYVIPPRAVNELTSDLSDENITLKQYCYLYKYDERGNCIYKRLPGCDPVNMVYDKANRLILTQDGNQHAIDAVKKPKEQWTVTKYDALGRVLYTGLINRSIIQSEKDFIHNNVIIESVGTTNQLTNTGYTCNSFAGDIIPLVVNYFDNYNFIPSGDNLIYDKSQEQNGYTAKWSDGTGLPTGMRTYILDGTGSNYLVSVMYYDDNGNIVQTRSTNHLGGYDLTYSQYDFTNKVIKTLKKHKISTLTEITELYTYSYDHAQRPLSTSYSLNGATPVTLASNKYDELGRLTGKFRHNGSDAGQIIYNIRNWATKIKSGTFEENLSYNKDLPTGTTACYNGNIAYSSWTYNGVTKGYSYDYDDLNRLNSAIFKQGTSLQPSGSFDESYTYDKMGNILTLQRKSNNKLVDDLTLHYTNGEKSNQIDWITDKQSTQGLNDTKEYQDISKVTSGEFAYDVNGNMTKDLDRDIYTIKYNVLNLPDVIQFKNGNQIKNLYDAGGQKLGTEYFTWRPGTSAPIVNAGDLLNISYSQTSTDQSGTAYIGNIEYNTLNGNASLTTLSRIYNDEGYVENPANPQYYYFRHDHLGDNREVWCANTNTVAQRTQYYPSGLPWAYDRTVDHPDLQHRKYNGKEFVEMHGYDTYDFDHRGYYPAAGIFTTIDWKAEDTPDQSPYSYASDNPVRYRDENGDGILDVLTGFTNAVSDDATMGITDYSGKSKPDDDGDYKTGQTAGHIASLILGSAEFLTGGGIAAGGATLAVAGSETVVAVPVGAAVAVKGGAIMAHSTMMMKSAVNGLKNQSTKTNETKVYSTRKEAKEARPKPDPAKPGEKRVTNQTRNKSGEGNKMKTDGSQTPHFHDKNHNNAKKPNVHYRTTKKIKPNE